MLDQLYDFLYVTNRAVTVIILCGMLPLDVILFALMGRLGWRYRLLSGLLLVVNFAWALSWFIEPERAKTFEPIMREVYLFSLLILKGSIIRQMYRWATTRQRHTALKPLSRQERAMGLLLGMGALSISTAIAIGFWLFSTYSSHQQQEAAKTEAIVNNTQMLSEFRAIIAQFQRTQDSTFALAAQNKNYILAIRQQGKANQKLAEVAAAKAERVARKLKAKEDSEKRGKSIPTNRIEKKKDNPNFLQRLFRRFAGSPPATPRPYPDDTYTVHNDSF